MARPDRQRRVAGVKRKSTPDPAASSSPPDATATPNDEAVEALRAEPEPGWADAIRRGRRDRAERLRSVFASFDGDDAVVGGPIDEVAAREHPEA